MGIQGFTKFINDRALLYFENYELRDCTLVIDGHSISCQLYNWKHWQFDARSNNSYGGDYDKYAYIVENFFGMLKEVKVKPIVVFDGGFEQRKLPTILKRMKDKIDIADKMNPEFESRQPNSVVFPLFLREAFKDVLRNLDISMLMCEYEGDSEIASIAKSLNCPVLTLDSDYFIFGAQYIPFRTLDSKVSAVENWRTGTYKCISCKIYRIENFLNSFQGLEENTLHLLPVLLGNDYISRDIFESFLSSINAGVSVQMQDRIQLVLDWLKGESAEMAIKKILKSFKTTKERLFILSKIEKIVTSYYFTTGRVSGYLNIPSHCDTKYQTINFKDLRKIIENELEGVENGAHSPADEDVATKVEEAEVTEHPDNSEEQISQEIGKTSEEQPTELTNSDQSTSETPETEKVEVTNDSVRSPTNGIHGTNLENGEIQANAGEAPASEKFDEEEEEEVPECSSFSFEESHLEKENTSANPISKVFRRSFTKCLHPSSFMDMLTQNKYYCIPQVENHCEENSHLLSFDILRAIHKILANDNSAGLTIVGRDEGTKVKWFPEEQYTMPVPSLEEIEQMTLQGRRETLYRILNIDNSFVGLLEHFPTEWHTFTIALKYATTKTTFETPLIYSLVLGFIILNYIDQRIGYYRSSERYKKKYYSFMQNLPPVHEHVPFRADKNCFYYFPNKDCIIFMQKIVHLFIVSPNENADSFDKHLVHQMAQIQSVMLHIKYLNALLKYPYPNLIIHQIFDGTFIYNLTKTFKEKSSELENNYLNVFFKDCPSILASLKYVLNMLNKQKIL